MATRSDPVLYFAHPINVYDTDLERALLARIAERFPGRSIRNPNTPEDDAAYKAKGMRHFIDDVLPSCDEGVLLAFRDGMIPAGVYAEAERLHDACCPVWEVLVDGTFKTWAPNPARRLTVDQTRARIRDADRKLLPY